jgi:histidinol-phosphate aminotransferase
VQDLSSLFYVFFFHPSSFAHKGQPFTAYQSIKGREYLVDELTKLGCTLAKPCANFIYFDTHHDPKEIRAALAERKIMISAFDFNRVSVGTEEQNHAFIAALKEILAGY